MSCEVEQPPHNRIMDRDYNVPVPPPDISPFAEIEGLGDMLAEQERIKLREK